AGHLGRAGAAARDLGRPLGVAAEQVVGLQRQCRAVVEDEDAQRRARPFVGDERALHERDAAHRAVGRARVVEVVVAAVDAVDVRPVAVLGLLLRGLLVLRRRAHRRVEVLRRRPHRRGEVLGAAHEGRGGLVVVLRRRAHGAGLLLLVVVLGAAHGAGLLLVLRHGAVARRRAGVAGLLIGGERRRLGAGGVVGDRRRLRLGVGLRLGAGMRLRARVGLGAGVGLRARVGLGAGVGLRAR